MTSPSISHKGIPWVAKSMAKVVTHGQEAVLYEHLDVRAQSVANKAPGDTYTA